MCLGDMQFIDFRTDENVRPESSGSQKYQFEEQWNLQMRSVCWPSFF